MKYTIEIELPDNDTVLTEIKTARVEWAVWGYSGNAIAKPKQPEIVRCFECVHNPKDEWFGCPMAGLTSKQRPETAWCWKGARKK